MLGKLCDYSIVIFTYFLQVNVNGRSGMRDPCKKLHAGQIMNPLPGI